MKVILKVINAKESSGGFIFTCPACGYDHFIKTFGSNPWNWDGNEEKPTVTPSLLIHKSGDDPRCHLFLTGGKIQYTADCEHKLAGQTIDMIEIKG